MPIKELFESYKEEFCSKCKNKCKEFRLCNITIQNNGKERKAKCDYYERNNSIEPNKQNS